MTNVNETLVHEGITYRKVSREAEVGEKVLDMDDGEVMHVYGEKLSGASGLRVGIIITERGTWVADDEYVVLEPVEDSLTLTEADIRNNPRQVIDLLGNLALRLTQLESKVERLGDSVEQAINAVARNVETWAREVETLKHTLKLNSLEFERDDIGLKTVSVSFYGNPRPEELAEKLSEVFAGTLTAEERREL